MVLQIGCVLLLSIELCYSNGLAFNKVQLLSVGACFFDFA